MSRMAEISKALLLENLGNVNGTRFLYSIGFYDGARVEREFQNFDFSKLDEINDTELKNKIKFLGLIGENWCVKYLGKFLNSARYYDGIQDNMVNHHHVWAMEALLQFGPKDIERYVVDYLGKLNFEIPMGSCDSDMYFNIGTSYLAYEMAMELGVKNKFSDIESMLKTFLPALSWGHHDFGGAEAKWLAELKGIEAFDDLVGYLNWYHRKYECWEQVDHRVVDAIVSMGSDAVPLLAKHVYIEFYSPNPGVLEALERLGADPTDYINLTEIRDYDIAIKELEFLRDRSVDRMHEKFVSLLDSYIHELDIPEIISELQLVIDKRIMMRFLNEERAIRGACSYFQEYPIPDAIKPLSNALWISPSDPYTGNEIIRALAACKDPDLLAKMMKWVSLTFNLEEDSYFSDFVEILAYSEKVLEWISSDESSIIEPIETFLKSDSQSDRMVAILFIGLISNHPSGFRRIQDAGHYVILHQLLEKKSSSEFSEDFKNSGLFHDRWIPRIKNIAHQSLDEVDPIVELANDIKFSQTPWEKINEVKDSHNLDDLVLKEAVIESIPNILQGISDMRTLIQILEKISTVNYLHRNRKFLDGIAGKVIEYISQDNLSRILELIPPIIENTTFHTGLAALIKRTEIKHHGRRELFETLLTNRSLLLVDTIREALRAKEPELIISIREGEIMNSTIEVMSVVTGKDYKSISRGHDVEVDIEQIVYLIKKGSYDALQDSVYQEATVRHSKELADLVDDSSLNIEDLLSVMKVVPKLCEDARLRKKTADLLKKIRKRYIDENVNFPLSLLMLSNPLETLSQESSIQKDRALRKEIQAMLALIDELQK